MEKFDGSLKELERRAYRSTFEDGVYDLAFGIIFLIMALLPVFEKLGLSRYIGYSLLVIPMVLPWIGKRCITIPRMGEVKFGPQRTKKKRFVWIICGIVLLLTLPLIIMMTAKSPLGSFDWKLLVIFVIPLFVLAVYSTDFPRLYIYAALLIFAVVEAEFLLSLVGSPLNTVLSFGLPGLVISVFGVVLLVKFIWAYPRREVALAE